MFYVHIVPYYAAKFEKNCYSKSWNIISVRKFRMQLGDHLDDFYALTVLYRDAKPEKNLSQI